MTTWWTRGVQLVGAVALVGAAMSGAACGGGASGGDAPDAGTGPKGTVDGGDAGNLTGDAGSLLGNTANLTSITVDPPTASIESLNGVTVKQAFKVTGHYDNGTTMPLTNGISWSASEPGIGGVDTTGLYTANGSLGGIVSVQASYQKQMASAALTVLLHIQKNGAKAAGNIQAKLTGASTPDAAVVWAYPYDGTVWPRGLLAPILQWNGGAAADTYYVHIKSATFELENFLVATGAPASQIALDNPTWAQFVDSTSGATQVSVARWDGTTASLIAHHTWTIAPASMRGTIYYWSNNLGRVLRIKPGAATADDFANQPPLNDPNQYVTSSCLMTCHTVSADGSTIVSGGGIFGGSYDLLTSKPTVYLGGTWGAASGNSSARFANSATHPLKITKKSSRPSGVAHG